MNTQSPTELLQQDQLEVLQEIHEAESTAEERHEHPPGRHKPEHPAPRERGAAEQEQSETDPSAQD